MFNKLKLIRQSKNVSQSKLAVLSGVSRQTIVTLESGEPCDVKISTLIHLADALGVDLKDICP